jgi:hypothetical protein
MYVYIFHYKMCTKYHKLVHHFEDNEQFYSFKILIVQSLKEIG